LWQFECHSKASAKELNPQMFDGGCQKMEQRGLSAFETAFPKIEQFITRSGYSKNVTQPGDSGTTKAR
jgi:hypothetical protein